MAVGFPVCLVFLTEVHNALRRRGSFLARPVHLLRNYILPLGALLILLVQAMQVSGEATPVRVVATVFGFVVLVLLLSGLNATMFQGAPEGSWRKRIPSIFLDVARFALIAVGVGIMLAYIWGAHIGGLFTALGVSSIVLGLTLQNSVGQIISGLLVLFEQPFQLGDWIETPTARGRVVEVNWRATHIDTGSGMLIMPNSVLAAASFTNFSRPPGTHSLVVSTLFSLDDPPDDVCAMLTRVAGIVAAVAAGRRAVEQARRGSRVQDGDSAAVACRRHRRQGDVSALGLVCVAAGRTAPRRGRRRVRHARAPRGIVANHCSHAAVDHRPNSRRCSPTPA